MSAVLAALLTVWAGASSASPAMPPHGQQMKRAVRLTVPALQRCYRRHLNRAPETEGQVDVEVAASPARPTRVRFFSPVSADRALHACVQRVLGRVRWPVPAHDPVLSRFRFTFRIVCRRPRPPVGYPLAWPAVPCEEQGAVRVDDVRPRDWPW